MTLIEVLRLATEHLRKHGSDSARLDAELLLAHSLRLRRIDLYLEYDRPLGEPELGVYRDLIARRSRGEPVAYLLGRKEFMGLEFEVTLDVLVPNPDTEVLVQRAVAVARESEGAVRVADVGTGSGCIAIAIAHYAPNVEVWASDLSPEALDVARRNAARHGVSDRVHFECGDLLASLAGPFELVCANLPYLAEEVQLAPEVTAQPAHALYSAQGGFALVGRLLDEAPAKLAPGGHVFAEIDPAILAAATEAAARSFAHHRVHRDLGGRERVVEAW